MKTVFAALFILLNAHAVLSQGYNIRISVTVAPPYSTKISDYTSNPGKIIAMVQNLSPTGSSAQIYLSGAITGESGISVYTESGYKPARPLTIAAGGSVMLNINNISDIFAEDHLVYEGITENELLTANGLPEDYYTICLRAWDWVTDQPLSDDDPSGCCSPFLITDIEPPMITLPFCGERINPTMPQNVIISWTHPAGAPVTTRYSLKMVEVLPSDHSPEDAINSARRPYFFRSPDNIIGTTFIYGPAQPALVKGKTYAFSVTAIDPSGKVRFRNDGKSEVCSFKYERESIDGDGFGRETHDDFSWGDVSIELPPLKLPTTVKGKLSYEYMSPDDDKKYPLAGVDLKLVIAQVSGNNNDITKCTHLRFHAPPEGEKCKDSEYGKELACTTTNNDGTFNFTYLGNFEYKLLAPKKSEYGDAIHRVVLICIEGAHKTYYFNPETIILPIEGVLNDLGNITTNVKSFNLDVTALPRKSGFSDWDNSVINQTLNGLDVYLCRKIDFSYQLFPLEDGKYGKDKVDEATKGKFSNLGLKVLAAGTTNANGNISFGKMVWHHSPEFSYYLVAECKPELDLNYEQGGPHFIVIPASIEAAYGSIDPSIERYKGDYFNAHKEHVDLLMTPKLPKIAGSVKSSENTALIAGVKVEVIENYNFTKEEKAWAIYPNYNVDGNLLNCINNDCGYYQKSLTFFTDASGVFEFKDLYLLYSGREKMVIGPTREVQCSLKGYKTIKSNCNILYMGQQKVLNGLTMQKGAKLKGRILDGDNEGQALAAHIRQPGGVSYISTLPWGYYELPVLYTPNEQQTVIVEREGYITDTITFYIKDMSNSLDIKLYKAKRRLKIYVHEKGNLLKPIVPAIVRILNVTKESNGQMVPLSNYTASDGIAEFAFENGAGDPNLSYRVKVSVMSNSSRNFEAKLYNIKIPVSKDPVYIRCGLAPASCIEGAVYAGSNNESPVAIAKVQCKVNYSRGVADTISDFSGPYGLYTLHNVPVRNYIQKFTASKAGTQFIGDEQQILVTAASDQCIKKDFHLTVYDDMDITHLMGFPMEVFKLIQEDNGDVWIKGNLTQLPSNEQFAIEQSAVIPFNKVFIKKSAVLNDKGVPVAEPVALPVKTSINTLNYITVFKSFGAKMVTTDGIQIDKSASGSYGLIKSRVVIPTTEFNSNKFSLPQVFLASASSTNISKLWLTAFTADKNNKKPVILPATGFFVCDIKGEALKYSIPNFENSASADLLKSTLLGDKIILNTTLHTACNNVTPGDLKIKMGNVEITKTDIVAKPTEPLKFNMDNWKLESTDWTLGTNGITINRANIKSQLEFSVEGLVLKKSSVEYDKSKVDFGSVKILGVMPVTMAAQSQGLIYTNYQNKNLWKLYAINPDNTPAGMISGLDGLNGQDLPVKMIELYSDGSPMKFYIHDKDLTIHNLVQFKPLSGSQIVILDKAVPPYFVVQGEYVPGLPYINSFGGNVAWIKTSDNKFRYEVNNPATINFTHNNMQFVWDLKSIAIKPDLFTAKGNATEKDKLGPVDVVLIHKSASSEIDIPSEAIIYITNDKLKYFKKLVGGMEVNRSINQWNNFWFEGEMVGMTGITDNTQPSRLKFVCEGEIKASGQSINVSKLDAFPGMELTYDIATSSLHGSLNISKDLMGMQASGVANCTFDPHGWYLNITGDIDIPGIGGCGLFGLFGDYNAVPAQISTNFGSLKCIPPEFQGKVSGFLVQGRMTKQLIPEIEWGVTLPKIDLFVGVQVRADLSLHARSWMSFDPNVNTYGIALLAEGNISGGISGGIYSLTTKANAQLGMSGIYYSNGSYNVTGCGSVKAGVDASVWLPEPVGWIGVDLTSPDIGLKMKISDSGTDFNLMLGSCGENLCPEPPM